MAKYNNLSLSSEENLNSPNETAKDVDALLDDTNVSNPTAEDIMSRVREMKEESEKIKLLQSEFDKHMKSFPEIQSSLNSSIEEKMEADNRSVYVGNVDYGGTIDELKSHFSGCGFINRLTIPCNKYNGNPKGFAYIEFKDEDSVRMAMALDDSIFRNRQIKIMPKRTNRPGMCVTNRSPRGVRSRGFSRGGRGGGSYAGFRPTGRPRSYGRRRHFAPY